ncbi:monooxygenase [Rhodobacteraceae bacterium 4F10]|nr:monooxygenase [Rhodobacteraceae bacterium 4F10]
MSLGGKKIKIAGAGIGGLTAALAFGARGAEVTVLEQSEAITEVGAGLQVSPNGFAVLRALGLEEAFRAKAVQGQAVELRDYRQSKLVSRLDLGLLPEDQPYFFIHRADLIDLLAGAVRTAGIKIRLLQKVDRIEATESPVVHLANGAETRADIVIGADGLHSRLRPELNGVSAPFFTRQVAWRATVPNTMNHPNVARVHMGPRRHLVSYPLRGGEIVNIVAVQERMAWAEEGWTHTDDPENLRAAFEGFGGEADKLLKSVDQVGVWGLFRHPVARVWHKGHTALLGDAAHPTLPFMAQGAVMAMEDAWVLADALDKTSDIPEGLAGYQARRHERVSKVIQTANGNAWKYHLSLPPMRFGAHMGLRLVSSLAPKKLLQQFDWIYRHDVTAE